MFRFFKEEVFLDKISLSKEDSHHYINVLRINEKEEVEISAKNGVFLAKYDNYNDGIVTLKKVEKIKEKNESDVKLTLIQAILKADKMETVFKAGTEIGVTSFYPLYTKRVVSKINNKENKKIDRWQKIIEAAAKQSKRDLIPKVNHPINLNEIKNISKDKEILVAYENEENLIFDDINLKNNDIVLIIGPEGGFEIEEIEFLKSIGAKIISLGNRILRAETASICSSYYIIHKLEGR
ncbi:MAG: RsmE family RNA methyltransferase [Peptoniphilaceae bacterium]